MSETVSRETPAYELSLCPFCGKPAELDREAGDFVYLGCSDDSCVANEILSCGSSYWNEEDVEIMVAAWNQRA